MMSGHDLFCRERLNKVGIRDIIHRESTTSHSKTGRLVQRILAYVNSEALTGIGVEDVAARFKVSRSLLELRFRELQGESVYEALLRIRLDEVKRRLRHTGETISEITAACGWKNPTPPKALFKKRFGISMREYRRQSKTI
jgi:AraC-like DNA-binding protein